MYELSGFAEKLNIQNRVIQRVIVYIICLDLQKKMNIQNRINSMVNCVHYMCGMFGFVEKLNIQNKKNLNEKLCTLCVHNI